MVVIWGFHVSVSADQKSGVIPEEMTATVRIMLWNQAAATFEVISRRQYSASVDPTYLTEN